MTAARKADRYFAVDVPSMQSSALSAPADTGALGHPWVLKRQEVVRFGIGGRSLCLGDWSASHEFVQKVEELGFDSYWRPDHPVFGPDGWITLAPVAASTPRLRLGTTVSCVAYRSPTLLARMVAAVDRISGGRPVQQPYLPVLVAGVGERITLRAVAQYADASNFIPSANTSLARVEHTYCVLREDCSALGRPYESVLRVCQFVPVLLAETAAALEGKQEVVPPILRTLDPRGSGVLFGTPDAAVQRSPAHSSAGRGRVQLPHPERPRSRHAPSGRRTGGAGRARGWPNAGFKSRDPD